MEQNETKIWIINDRGRPQFVEIEDVEELKRRGSFIFPPSKLVYGKPPQTYYPQYDKLNPTRETRIISDEGTGDILDTEIL